MINQSLLDSLQASVNAAGQCQTEMLNALSLFSQKTVSPEDTVVVLQDLQLLLQLRLDTQETVRQILLCQQNLAALLGLSLHNSYAVNSERLAYALGSEDLHHLLTMLNQLAEALLRLLQRKAKENRERREALMTKKQLGQGKKADFFEPESRLLKQARLQQQSFLFHLKQLNQYFESMAGQPVPGPVHDFLAQLEGPVSHFYQAEQHGLLLSASLYQQLTKQSKLEPQLSEVLALSQKALKETLPPLGNNHLFTAGPAPAVETLEARAEAKRLRPFIIGGL